VRYAGLSAITSDAFHAPWWFTRIAILERRIENLYEAAQYDVDKMTAPKDLWPSRKSDELKDWLDSRDTERERRDAERQ